MVSGSTRADVAPETAAEHYQKWKRLAPLGLVAVGFGASLAVLNAGLCLFGDAVKHRALYEWRRDE
jgi:hypothetical protein